MALSELPRSPVVIDMEAARRARGVVTQKKVPRPADAVPDEDSGEPEEPVDFLAARNAMSVKNLLGKWLPAPDSTIHDDDQTGW